MEWHFLLLRLSFPPPQSQWIRLQNLPDRKWRFPSQNFSDLSSPIFRLFPPSSCGPSSSGGCSGLTSLMGVGTRAGTSVVSVGLLYLWQLIFLQTNDKEYFSTLGPSCIEKKHKAEWAGNIQACILKLLLNKSGSYIWYWHYKKI